MRKTHLQTQDPGFSSVKVKQLQNIEFEDIEQLRVYYFQLRRFYFSQHADGLRGHSHGSKIGVYLELRDLERFLKLLGKPVTIGDYDWEL